LLAGLAPVDPKQPPKETVQIPTAGPSPLPLVEYVQGEQRQIDGTSVITGGLLVSGSGYAGALAYGVQCDGNCPAVDLGTGSAIFNGAGQLTQADLSSRGAAVYTLQSGSHASFGTDGILAWGRWIGTVAVPGSLLGTESYSADQGLHYVVGTPTAAMPTVGIATYNLKGATQPTYLNGDSSPGVLTGNLNVDFGKFTVGENLNIAMPDGAGYGIGGSAQISGNTFSGQQTFGTGTLTTSGTGGACLSGCNALVQGFFAGTTAERAGLAYHVDDFFNGKDVLGAAAFAKQ
jgi:hypothetical protein